MNRTGLVLSAAIAIVGTARIVFPQQVMSLFTLDAIVAMLAVLTAVIAYGVWFGPLKFLSGSLLLGAVGFGAIAFALGSIMSPTLLGLRESFIPIVDVFMILESGIVMAMIGLEKKRQGALSPLLVISLVWQLLQRRLQRQSATVPASQ